MSARVIANFRKHFDLPRDLTASFFNVSEPTVYRWIKSNKTLERNHSIQLFELTDPPENRYRYPAPTELADIDQALVDSNESLALIVPSSIITTSNNDPAFVLPDR